MYDISKPEEFFMTQFSNIPIDSLLQTHFRQVTERVQTDDLPIISLPFICTATLRGFTITLFHYNKNNANVSLPVTICSCVRCFWYKDSFFYIDAESGKVPIYYSPVA